MKEISPLVHKKVNEIARLICEEFGYQAVEDLDFSKSKNPRARKYYQIALKIWTAIQLEKDL